MEYKSSFNEKITQLTKEFQKKAESYNLEGDDRMLSELTTDFSARAEKLVREEIKAIQDSAESSNEKKLKLVKLREQIRDISWLPKGFKSSLNMMVVFVSAKID